MLGPWTPESRNTGPPDRTPRASRVVDSAFLILSLVIVIDFALSLWNAYASGLIWGLLRNQPGRTFSKVCAGAGLGLAFAGMAYATLIVLGYVALVVGFLAVWDFLYLASFDLLVFGGMIIGFGLVITVQSVTIAYRKRSFGSIAVASWNVFAEIWDIATYAEGFKDASAVLRGDRRDRTNLYAIVAVAVGVALLITYVAFRQGLRKAQAAIAASPGQEQGDAAARGQPHHLRRAVIAGVVVVVVAIAAIWGLHYLSPSPQVKVNAIDVWSPNDVCGLNSHPIYYSGFTDLPGASDNFSLQVQNFNATTCTVAAATTNSSGFALSNVQLPLTVGAGQSGFLNLTVTLPSSSFDGDLNIVYW